MQVPSPTPRDASATVAKRYEAYAVLAAARTAPDAEPQSIVQVLQAAFAMHLPSSSAAKKACRRGMVLVDGFVARTTTQACYPVYALSR